MGKVAKKGKSRYKKAKKDMRVKVREPIKSKIDSAFVAPWPWAIMLILIFSLGCVLWVSFTGGAFAAHVTSNVSKPLTVNNFDKNMVPQQCPREATYEIAKTWNTTSNEFTTDDDYGTLISDG